MPLRNYGVLKAVPIDTARDGDWDHFQIHARAGAVDYRLPIKVQAAHGPDAAAPLFYRGHNVPDDLKMKLAALAPGFHNLKSKAGGLAQDYVRGQFVQTSKLRPISVDVAGANNDLKDYLKALMTRAITTAGTTLYAFGERWGPEVDRPDEFFGFLPGNGVHDMHMNQGSFGKWRRDNGVWQDGCLFLSFPNGDWITLFFAFQTQSFVTDLKGQPMRRRRPLSRLPDDTE